jgi:hypothetical protein
MIQKAGFVSGINHSGSTTLLSKGTRYGNSYSIYNLVSVTAAQLSLVKRSPQEASGSRKVTYGHLKEVQRPALGDCQVGVPVHHLPPLNKTIK